MENAEMTWKFFIPAIKAFPIGQVEVMLMIMYDENGILLTECTRLVAVRYTRIGRDMSFSSVRQIHPRGCTWRVSDVQDALE